MTSRSARTARATGQAGRGVRCDVAVVHACRPLQQDRRSLVGAAIVKGARMLESADIFESLWNNTHEAAGTITEARQNPHQAQKEADQGEGGRARNSGAIHKPKPVLTHADDSTLSRKLSRLIARWTATSPQLSSRRRAPAPTARCGRGPHVRPAPSRHASGWAARGGPRWSRGAPASKAAPEPRACRAAGRSRARRRAPGAEGEAGGGGRK